LIEHIKEWKFAQNRSVLHADVTARRGSDTMTEDYFAVCRAPNPCWLPWISWIRNASYSATCEKYNKGCHAARESQNYTDGPSIITLYERQPSVDIQQLKQQLYPIKIILDTNENLAVFGATVRWTMGMSKACKSTCHIYFSLPHTRYVGLYLMAANGVPTLPLLFHYAALPTSASC
jgi:hypothetical protein